MLPRSTGPKEPVRKKVVSYPTKKALIKNNDPFFRGFDNAFPDYYQTNGSVNSLGLRKMEICQRWSSSD